MEWYICFILATICFVAFIGYLLFSLIKYKKFPKIISTLLVFLAGCLIFWPVTFNDLLNQGDKFAWFNAIWMSVHDSVQLFVLNASFDYFVDISEALKGITGFATAYHVVAVLLHVSAPALLAGALFTVLFNLISNSKYKLTFNKEIFVFSELNIKSLNLAKSIIAHKKKAKIIFCDISEKTKEEQNDLYEQAKDLRVVLLSVDIASLKFEHHSKKEDKGVWLFLMSDNDEKNLNQYLALFELHNAKTNFRLHLFSRSTQCDLAFNQPDKNDNGKNGQVKHMIRRKYDIDFLIIYNYLYNNGVDDIFKTAKDKKISIIIVGLGLNGKMLTKALAWYCQMDGYRLEINAFDNDPLAREKFLAEAPDLLNPIFAEPYHKQENQYVINIHSGVDINSQEFANEVNKLVPTATMIFTCLGSDELNLKTAVRLRTIFQRHRHDGSPKIVSIVYTGNKEFINDVKNAKGKSYNIKCIGSYESTYSYEFIIDSKLEKEAIEAQRKYSAIYGQNEKDTEDDVRKMFSYTYNFRSNCATAIHLHAREKLKMNGAEKGDIKLMTDEEILATKILEHRRWNAWTRAEGYVYGPKRDDLALQHQDLVPFDDLSDYEKEKDTVIGIKIIETDLKNKEKQH